MTPDSLFLLLAVVFLTLMMVFSSRKRKKAAEELKTKVVKGSYVMLTSGIYGKVAGVDGDKISFETSPGQKMTVALGAVRSIEEEPKTKKTPTTSTASKGK